MKAKQLLILIAFSIIFARCNEPSEKETAAQNAIFTRSVGGLISAEVAARWVERKRSHATGREEEFSVSAENLRALLQGTSNKLGVIFHHAEDTNGDHHIIITPVKADLQSWKNGPVLDASSNEFIDATICMLWVNKYKELHPAGPWSHFFGIDMFDEMLSIGELTEVEMVAALNDSDIPQLLLYAWVAQSLSGTRIKSQHAEVYDAALLCPTLCGT